MGFENLNPGSIVVIVIALALAPFVAVMVTSFTKMVIVFSLLRNALGLQQVPPNVVINGLAIILSIYVMYPVLSDTYDNIQERSAELSEEVAGFEKIVDLASHGKAPLQAFLYKHSDASERQFFLKNIDKLMQGRDSEPFAEDDFMVVVPAFVVSELTDAFQIGFLIYLPFLIIDMIVSNILLALGMMMLSPTTISLPFKLLLFVFISGWSHLVHGLVMTYM